MYTTFKKIIALMILAGLILSACSTAAVPPSATAAPAEVPVATEAPVSTEAPAEVVNEKAVVTITSVQPGTIEAGKEVEVKFDVKYSDGTTAKDYTFQLLAPDKKTIVLENLVSNTPFKVKTPDKVGDNTVIGYLLAVYKSDPSKNSDLVTVVEDTTAPAQAEVGINADADAQNCETVCSWDLGVDEKSSDSNNAQVGFAWGKSIAWEDNELNDEFNFVTLQPGWYENITIENGGVTVLNFPNGADSASVNAQVDKLVKALYEAKGLPVPGSGSLPVWDSIIPSISNSSSGPVSVGEGLEFPQLDEAQTKSCAPEQSPCDVSATIAEGQIGILFGVQINYADADLAGPTGDGKDPLNRCDLIVLGVGVFPSLEIIDARIEVYNVPVADPVGWMQNLVAERAEEQLVHHSCPAWETVEVWSPTGVSGQYVLTWEGNDATAIAPK